MLVRVCDDLLPIPGAGGIGGGRRLAGSGQEVVTGKVGVEEDENNPQQGGGGAAAVCFFSIHGAGNVSLQLGYLVGHPPHGQGPGGVTGHR